MSRKCDICGKGTATGMQVSHSHIRNKKTWKPNIQKVRVVVDGTPKKRMSAPAACVPTKYSAAK